MKKKSLLITIYITLFCCFIFPSGFISYGDFRISKFIFSAVILIQYIVSLVITRKISKQEIIMISVVFVFFVITKNFSMLPFITIIYLMRIKPTLSDIKNIFDKTNILYICLLFTIIYSLIYARMNDSRNRFAFTAIREINQSGLAIFCLGCLLLVKNRKVGLFTLVFGLLTFSRSYYLAILCLIFFKLIKKTKFNNFLIKYCTYLNLTIISSLFLILIGYFYFYQYRIGNVTLGSNDTSRIIDLLDYSNLFRFQANVLLLVIIKNNPLYLLIGTSDEVFYKLASATAKELSLPYRNTPPHNLFFSHLKKYGMFSVIETLLISDILKKYINRDNFGIYIAIFLYSIFLGAGLYSYWMYLTIFTLIYFSKNESNTYNLNKYKLLK